MFDKDQPQPQSETESLADIVREVTDGGRSIVRFLIDATDGTLDDFEPCHRLDATEQLLDFGGQKDLVDFVRDKTNDGRLIVRFLLDVAQRKIDDVTERDRVKARQLLNQVFNGKSWISLPVPPEQ